MIIKTADYDDNAGSLNALAVEPTGIIADLSHAFNRCAIGRITLVDKDGSIMRKYDVDAANDSVHVGPGRVMVQEPAPSPDDDVSNIIFDGRIVKALSTMGQNTVTLIAEDWMNQLKDDRIIYDMREKIYQNIRESTIYSAWSIPVYVPTESVSTVYCKADDGGVYTDETEEAANTTTNDMTLLPAAPAINDYYYFGFDIPNCSITLDVSTAGNGVYTLAWEYWTGTAWEYAGPVDSVEDTNKRDLKVAGVQKFIFAISVDNWASCAVDGLTKYWARIRVDTFGSIVTSPKGKICTAMLRTNVYCKADDGGSITDETDEAADANINDMTLLPTVAVPVVNDAYYFGFNELTYVMCLAVETTGDWIGTMAWEYWDGDSWEVITQTDAANARWTFESGGGIYEWTIPADDWTTCAVDSTTKYWIRGRVSAYTGITTRPVGTQCYGAVLFYNIYDNDVIITPDIHNGKYVVFPNSMAGSIVSSNGPYEETVSPAMDTDTGGVSGNLWNDTNHTSVHRVVDGDAGTYTITYKFKMPIGITGVHMTDLIKATVKTIYSYKAVNTTATDGTCELQYKHTGTGNFTIITKVTNDIDTDYNRTVRTFDISSIGLDNLVDTNGDAQIRFEIVIQDNADLAELNLYYLQLEIEALTTSFTDVLEIRGCGTRFITVYEDVTSTGEALWTECPYCIADKAYTHINGLVTGGDPLVTLTTSVEVTTSINTKHYEENTRFEILRDVAQGDKAVLWLPLNTKEVQYKKTFAAGGTAMTDASVIKWTSTEWDWNKVVNEYHIYGMRIGDTQVVVDTADLTPDPGVTSKTTYGVPDGKSEVIRNIGLTTVADAESFGEAMASKECDILLLLEAELLGLSTLRLGDRVQITSTLLGLTSADYVITAWSYNSKNYRTHIKLHPRSSVGYIEYKAFGEHLRDTDEAAREARRNIYLPAPAGTVFADP